MKYDLVGLTVSGAVRLVGEIRKIKLECEVASIERKWLRDALAEAEARLDRLEYSEALLKNRRSELVRWGLQTLEVGSDGSPGPTTVGVSSSETVPARDPILDLPPGFIDPEFFAQIQAKLGFANPPLGS